MPVRHYYRRYKNFILKNTPLYKWSILPVSIGIVLFIIGGILYFAFGDNILVAIISITGASLIGSLSGDLRRRWDRHLKNGVEDDE